MADTQHHQNRDASPAELPEPYAPDWSELEAADKEGPFLSAGVELLKEATTYAVLVAGIVRAAPHDRDTAIRVAMLVRLVKLDRSLLLDVCEGHGDQQMALSRQLLDTAAALRVLSTDEDGALHQSFIEYSLVSEREFLKNIADRQRTDGTEWPIEARIQRSIDRSARAAGISDVSALPSRRNSGWPSAEERIAEFGITAYTAFRAGSSAIHGSWSELLRNHLTQVEGGFEVDLASPRPRPQPLLAGALLTAVATQDYLSRRSPEEREFFSDAIDDLARRLRRVDELHEAQLQRS